MPARSPTLPLFGMLLGLGVLAAGLFLFLKDGASHSGAGVPGSSAATAESPAPAGSDARLVLGSGSLSATLHGDPDAAGATPTRVSAAPVDGLETAAPAVRLTGQVIERSSGAAIAGAELEIDRGANRIRFESNAEGDFEVEWRPTPESTIEVRHPDFVDRRRPLADAGQPLLFELERSGAIEARVEGATEAQLEAAQISLWRYTTDRYRGTPDFEVPANNTGIVLLRDIEPGEYAIGLVLEGGPLVYEEGLEVLPERTTSVRVSVPKQGVLTGQVLTREAREPIAGVRICVRPNRQGVHREIAELGERTAVTDSEGRYRLVGLTPGVSRLTLETDWPLRLEESLEVSAVRPQERDFLIRDPGVIAGHVLTANGRPAGGAEVFLGAHAEVKSGRYGGLARLRADGRVRRAIADESGAFEFTQVPSAQELELTAWRPGSLNPTPRQVIKIRPGEARTSVELNIGELLPLAGIVRTPLGEPLAGVELTFRSLSGLGDDLSPSVQSGFDGRFLFTSVPATRVRLELERPGYRRLTRGVVAKGAEIELMMQPELDLSGFVTDEDGYAIPGARVSAQRVGMDKQRGRACNEFGWFEIPNIDEGEWDLSVRVVGSYGSSDPVRVRVPCEPVQLIASLERRPPRAAATGEIVHEATGEPVPGVRFGGYKGGGTVALLDTQFRISGIAPTRTRFVARAPGFEPVFFDPVDLPPGSEVDLGRAVARPAVRVEVRVVDADGKPLQGARVLLRAMSAENGGWGRGGTLKSGAGKGGKYTFQNVPRYRWRLIVVHPGWKREERIVRVNRSPWKTTVALKPKRQPRPK